MNHTAWGMGHGARDRATAGRRSRFAPAAGADRGHPRSRAGFTLLEVLVSLAIVLLMAVFLGSSYLNIQNSYAALAKDRSSEEDVRFARATLLATTDIEKAQDGDEFDSINDRHVRWSSTIEPSEKIADLFKVTFEVEIQDPGAEDQKITETFSVMRPTWSTGDVRNTLLADAKERFSDAQKTRAAGLTLGTGDVETTQQPGQGGRGGRGGQPGGGGGDGRGGGGRGRGGDGAGGRGGRGDGGGQFNPGDGGPGGGQFPGGGGGRGGGRGGGGGGGGRGGGGGAVGPGAGAGGGGGGAVGPGGGGRAGRGGF